LWEFSIDDGLVLVRQDVCGLFLLNSSAQLLWNELRRGVSHDEVVSGFAAHFGIPLDVARRDIEVTVAAWRQGLLAPLQSPSPKSFPPAVVQGPSVIDGRDVRSVDCLVNGKPMRLLLESGDVWDEISPRLEPVRPVAARMAGRPPEHTFTVGNAAGRVLVLRDGICIGSEENTAGARAILLQGMAWLAGGWLGEPAAILHAGGCGGILLAGHTHSGKSTLCAALMSRGLPYHCDDSALLDREFRVAPMPFPIMLRPGSWPLLDARFPELKHAPVYSRWGTNVRFLAPVQTAATAAATAMVTALVFVKHDPTAETQMTEIGVLDSLLALQRSGFWVEHTHEGIQRFLRWLAGIRRYSLLYAELKEAERVILELATGST
jgi:hypothetical protein